MQVALAVLAILAIGLVAQLALIGRLQYRSAQVGALNAFRTKLALGTAPLGPVGTNHHLLPLGTPIAVITVPAIGLRAVVLEGTTGSVLSDGPGHVRTTVFPGGAGDSVLLGRASLLRRPLRANRPAAAGPEHHRGDPGGDVTLPRRAGPARRRPYRPHLGHEVRAHAGHRHRGLPHAHRVSSGSTPTKVGAPLAAADPPSIALLASEAPLATDVSTLWALVFWLEALAVLLGLAVWSWRRWGHAQTWIIFSAPMLVVWLFITDQVARLLPNLT